MVLKFDHLQVGDFITLPFRSVWKDIFLFRDAIGDRNPIHWDIEYTSKMSIGKPIQHGAALVSAVCSHIGNIIPGEGALIVAMEFEFPNPLYVGDVADITLRVSSKSESMRTMVLSVSGKSNEKVVIRGCVTVKSLV